MTTAAQQAISDIKAKAESAGFRMSDVCRVAEIDQAQVSRWASGVTEPLYGSVRRLEQSVDALIAARLKTLSEAVDSVASRA
jgi:transcriptional regulator with XRE-family HTH domain